MAEARTKIDAKSHFGVPVFRARIEGFARRREALIEALWAYRREREAEKVYLSGDGEGNWRTKGDLWRNKDPQIAWLSQRLHALVRTCVASTEGERPYQRIVLREVWVNFNERGAWNRPHIHLPYDWAGVCYVSNGMAPGDPGLPAPLILLNPLPLGARWNRPLSEEVEPEEGMLLLFPAYLVHLVAPHTGSAARISVAFNVLVERSA